jgi:hypothetical protein
LLGVAKLLIKHHIRRENDRSVIPQELVDGAAFKSKQSTRYGLILHQFPPLTSSFGVAYAANCANMAEIWLITPPALIRRFVMAAVGAEVP